MANKKGRSEKKTTFWGKPYTQHYDSKGNKSGRSEKKETFFGKKYTQHFDAKGEKRGRSENKESFFGNKYSQKYNAKGEKSGRSEQKERFFGGRYTQHYDQEGTKTDWSEKKETFFGREYTQRYGDEKRSSSYTNNSGANSGTYGSSGGSSGGSGSYGGSTSASPASSGSSVRPAGVLALIVGAALILGFISLVGKISTSRNVNPPIEFPRNAYISTLQLNVRRGPGTEYGVTTRLSKGAMVACLERSQNAHGENWVRVRFGSSEGWVNEEYVSVNSPPAEEAPISQPPAAIESPLVTQAAQSVPDERNARLPAPRLVGPDDGAVMNYYPRRTTLEWLPVEGAATYTAEIQFLSGTTWNDLTEWLTNYPDGVFVPPTKLTNTNFTFNWVGAHAGRWRVWALDADNKAGSKSEWRHFQFTR